MAKLDFSSLKTADLRSVAPVDESAIPRAQQAPQNEAPVSSNLPQIAEVPASVAEVSAPVQTVSLPHVPAQPVVRNPPAPVHASKKISLTSMRGGGPSVVASVPTVPVPVASVSAQPAVRTPTVAVSTFSKRSNTTISLGTKSAVSIPVPVTEVPVTVEEPTVDKIETVSEPIVEWMDEEGRAPIEGIDIIQAAKVIGTEGETIANEILTEALSDPEAVKKAAEEKAVAAIVIPETEKVFFPNLEMDDDFFDDPLFEGIVPPKPDKKPEVRQPLEMKKEEIVPQAAVAESAPSENAETVSEEPAVELIEAVTEVKTDETPAVAEPAVIETPPTETPAVANAEVSEPLSEAVSEPPVEAYVETVAKDLSAERKGGLSKLFGERKVLVRAMAGFFAVAVLGVGAFQFASPSIKTSGPEAMGTGSEIPKYVPTGETKIIGEGVRVFTGRRPNVQKNKKPLVEANSGAVTSTGGISSTGTVALPVSDTGATASGTETPTPVLDAPMIPEAPTSDAGSGQISVESPVSADLPANGGAVEMPQPDGNAAPGPDAPTAPMPN